MNSNRAATLLGGHSLRRLSQSLWGLLLMGLSGCGGDQLQTAPVHGSVTLGGTPLDRGTIVFTPSRGRVAHGKIGADGGFSLSTYGTEDGAIVGAHKIAVFDVPQRDPGGRIDFDRPPHRNPIPEVYRNPDQSGLTFEVESGVENVAKFELRVE